MKVTFIFIYKIMKDTLLNSVANGYQKNLIVEDVEEDSAVGHNKLTQTFSDNYQLKVCKCALENCTLQMRRLRIQISDLREAIFLCQ